MTNKSCYIIAEIGVNHNGSLETAKSLIEVASKAGCDAVKFQTFKADSLVIHDAPLADYQIINDPRFTNQYEMIKSLELKYDDHFILKEYAQRFQIDFISTPFDEVSLKFLVKDLKLDVIKLSSGDLTNSPLLLLAGKIAKKVIISTGMASLGEIELALCSIAFGHIFKKNPETLVELYESVFENNGIEQLKDKVVILHCISQYPAPYEEINLKAMQTIKNAFKIPVGYSDHTLGIEVAIASVALGAKVIEKHITLDRNSKGPDHKASIEPNELINMVKSIRHVERALGGNGFKKPSIVEKDVIKVARKGIYAAKTILSQEKFNFDNLLIKRPFNGVAPSRIWDLVNQKASKQYELSDSILD
jgi:N-acetylneuraminate synthase